MYVVLLANFIAALGNHFVADLYDETNWSASLQTT
jgi:hypothetical protein